MLKICTSLVGMGGLCIDLLECTAVGGMAAAKGVLTPCTVMVLSQNAPQSAGSLPHAITPLRSVRRGLGQSTALLFQYIGCKRCLEGPSRSALSPTREGYAGHPDGEALMHTFSIRPAAWR